MKLPHRTLRAIALTVLALPLFSGAAGGDIAVVVRQDTPASDLTMNEVRRLLLGEKRSWNGSLRVTLLIREPGARERQVILRSIYHMNEAEFCRYWIERMFRNETQTGPKVTYSDQMSAELVATIPGSIAFVDAGRVPGNLKQVKIDGKLPGERGYALR